MTNELRIKLPAEPTSVRLARQFLVETLGPTPAASRLDDACLLVSELVSNALLHARSCIVVVVSLTQSRVRVDVQDESGLLPRPRRAGPTAISGRGLEIVECLADDWGAEQIGSASKRVWFELLSTS